MESPEGDRVGASSSPTPSSSPAVQESPFTAFASNLTPIKSIKAAPYASRFPETHFRTPPPVFKTPRLDQRDTSFLKSNEKDAAGSDVFGHFGNQLNAAVLNTSFEKEISTPLVCIDEYLNDPAEVEECTNPDDLNGEQANNKRQLQSSFSGSRETNSVVNYNNNGDSRDFESMLPGKNDVKFPPNSLNSVDAAVNPRDAENADRLVDLTSKKDRFESHTSVILGAEYSNQYASQDAGVQRSVQDGDFQSMPEVFQTDEAIEDFSESSISTSRGSTKEATSLQRGTRRHLQFEAAMAHKGSTSLEIHGSRNASQRSANLKPLDAVSGSDCRVPSHVELTRPCDNGETIRSTYNAASQGCLSQPTSVRSQKPGGNLALSGPIPCGIGLHLNSVARSVSITSDVTSSKILPGSTSSGEKKPTTSERPISDRNENISLIPAVAGDIYAHVDNFQQDDQAVREISSATSYSIDCVQEVGNSLAFSEQQVTSSEARVLTSLNTNSGESNQVSPKKKRKKAALTSESEGCKRCNCRRSKCLKLYCECFAAGVYCVDSCACESCFNKPEYEDTVLDTRQQIESRNPLAFAPKIVKQATDSPANVVEDRNGTTPSSARHKRGCNCKKSKCLKKYCECFQANVGCSDGCRCEGCNNSFGKKADLTYRRAERWENPSHVKRDTMKTVNDSTKALTPNNVPPSWEDLLDLSHLTPLSLPFSETIPSSTSPNISDCAKVSLSQSNHTNLRKSSAGQLRWRYSPLNFTPHLCDNKAANESLSSEKELHGLMKDDDMPEILKNNSSTPTKAIKASSPNRKRVSPPQHRSRELKSSSSSPGLRNGRKYILQAVPSFPPLTPYSKSKDGISQLASDFEGKSSDE